MSVSFSQNVFSSDGSTLSRWNNNGITISSSIGNPAPSFSSTGSAQYAYTICLPSLVGYTIYVDMYASNLVNFFFGCDVNGKGQLLRLDGRASSYSGFGTTTNWLTWGGPPSVIILTGNTWYTFKIVINSTATNGMSWYYNNTFGANGTFVNNGGYIGLQGDRATGGYWDNISIYPNTYTIPPSINLSSPLKSGLIWSSYNGYFADNVDFFSTASPLNGLNGVSTGIVTDLSNLTLATGGNFLHTGNTPDYFSIQWIGYFLAPQTGSYTWSTSSDDASYLWIGYNAKEGFTTANAIVNNGGVHALQTRVSSPITLTAGVYYPIRIQYGDATVSNEMQTYFILPGTTTTIYNGTGYYFNSGASSNTLSLVPGSINFVSNTNIINYLIPDKQPWGIYDAALWNSTTNTLPEARGNGRNATATGTTLTYGSASGNGASASIPYISGVTTSILTWPAGSIPTNFTICSITRYTTAGTNNSRILTSTTGNWLHGHWSAKRGVAYYEGWKTQTATSIGALANWLVMCGNNSTTPIPNNILVDSVASGIVNAGTGGYTLTTKSGLYGGEVSDWNLSYVVIYDTQLTDGEMLTVSNVLLSYLQNGYM